MIKIKKLNKNEFPKGEFICRNCPNWKFYNTENCWKCSKMQCYNKYCKSCENTTIHITTVKNRWNHQLVHKCNICNLKTTMKGIV